MRIETVEISKLRGIPGGWPALPLGERGLIVYGPNGVGKSSIIDALEATISGRSTLFSTEAVGVTWAAAAPHLKGGVPTVKISGKSLGKSVELTLGAPPNADVADWVAAGKSSSFVLRRYMLLKFIEAQPKPRYDQIEPFLNLDEFTILEAGLRELAKRLETDQAVSSNVAAGKAQIIRQTFGFGPDQPLAPSELGGAILERLLEGGLIIEEAALSDPQAVKAVVAAELGSEKVSQKLAALGAAKQHAQQLTSISLLRPLYEQALYAADDLAAHLAIKTTTVPLALLVAAHEHFAAVADTTCPVCEVPIDREKLIARLAVRIEEDEEVRKAASLVEERLIALQNASESARVAYRSFTQCWSQAGCGPLPGCYASADALFNKFAGLTVGSATNERQEIFDALAASECSPPEQVAALDALIVSTGGGAQRSKLSEASSMLEVLTDHLEAFQQAENSCAALAKRARVAISLHLHAENARKDAVQKTADKVARLANKFYDTIHPGEGIATSRLRIRPAVAGSLELFSTFYGKEAQPRLYYSESHLDTLGLCYFLAIRKLEVQALPIFRLLLVDDVLHSVDAEHRNRLAKLLRDEFSDHQMIIVTHDKFFYDKLRSTFGNGYKYISINGWDIDGGPRLSDPLTDFDRVTVADSRAGKGHDELASAGGRFFEWLLKRLSEALQVSLPARFSREHDIGSMWPPVAQKLKKRASFASANPDVIDEIADNAWVRNKIGAHDNEAACAVHEKEVLELLDGLAKLYNATHCNGCSTTIQRGKTDLWRCECSQLQYPG